MPDLLLPDRHLLGCPGGPVHLPAAVVGPYPICHCLNLVFLVIVAPAFAVSEILPSLIVGPILDLHLHPGDLDPFGDPLLVPESKFVRVASVAVSTFWVCIWFFLEAYACAG